MMGRVFGGSEGDRACGGCRYQYKAHHPASDRSTGDASQARS